jgi:hypothetical protein
MNLQKIAENQKVTVLTFIGSHKFGFYKDCRKSEKRLRNSLAKFDIPLVTFELKDLVSVLTPFSSTFFYLFTRYGVGAWFWKPIIIRYAMSIYPSEYLIYVDSDCAFSKDPVEMVETALRDHEVAFFAQNNKLDGWISKRAQKILDVNLEELRSNCLVTAGVVFLRNSSDSQRQMKIWEKTMRDPRLLLHPVFSSRGPKHLHDQSILSTLIAKGAITCNLIDSGFFSLGVESTAKSLEDSWIYTGNILPNSNPTTSIQRLFLIFDHYSRRIYDVCKTLIIFPIHLIYFLAELRIISKK